MLASIQVSFSVGNDDTSNDYCSSSQLNKTEILFTLTGAAARTTGLQDLDRASISD